MGALLSTARGLPGADKPVKVMVVDDSVVIRGLIGRWLEADKDIEVVASHRHGRAAVEDINRSNPDVVVLDIEMPEMDGMEALPLLLKARPGVVVIMASTLTRRNAEISLRALSLGASDYIPKPETTSQVTTSIDFRREVVEKVKNLGRRSGVAGNQPRAMTALTRSSVKSVQTAPARAMPKRADSALKTRSYATVPPRIIAIGSSTGGPQALAKLVAEIGPAMSRVPVVITQHMPATFTTILAEHLAKASNRPAAEAVDGEVLRGGQIYVAPGGLHLSLIEKAGQTTAKLSDGPQINFCKPAVDPLFESVAKIYGAASLAIVLTGMGADGANGVKVLGAAGASVIAQDEASSVVWGMPGAAANTGQCSEILPLDAIGPKTVRILSGVRL